RFPGAARLLHPRREGRGRGSRPRWPVVQPGSDSLRQRGELVEGRAKQMITIGQLAAYAGVTIKAVRHYHQRGLLAEPPRDASGYRRYSAQDAIELVKIKT